MYRKLGDAARRAARSVVEQLELRVLLHANQPDMHINFGPATSGLPAQYDSDTGAVFGDRGDEDTFGWQTSNAAHAERTVSASSTDPRYNTFEYLVPGNNWEIALENGDYTVHVVAGGAIDKRSVLKVDVEGVRAVDQEIPRARDWAEGTVTVTVTDGRLTLSAGEGAVHDRLAFVDITPWDEPPTISVAPAAAKRGADPGSARLIFSRTGSISNSATYDFLIGGSARNGKDYKSILDSVTFAPGEASTAVNITPKAAAGIDGAKTVMLTLLPSDEYELDDHYSATVNIAAPQTSTAAAAPTFKPVRINFQPSGTPIPPQYQQDNGAVYGLRSSGLTYGWNTNNAVNTRDKNLAASPDQRYDTLIHMQRGGTYTWEMGVPNGTYTVRVVAGDPGFFNSVYHIAVEGVLTVNATPTTSTRWAEGTKTVTIKDGRLTISNASGAVNDKIDFIEISPGASPIPVVKAFTSDSSVSESGDAGSFTMTRTGNLAAPLTVNYTLSGTANNGADYQALSGAATFAAGVSGINIYLKAINDTIAEGPETIVINLSPSPAYSLASTFSGTATIADNDTAGTMSWTSAAPSPIGRVEAQAAAVGNKLYVFGGYAGSWAPQGRSDVYDVTTNKWSRIADMPEPLTHGATEVVGTDVYIAGGYVVQSDGVHQTFGTTHVWKYDTLTNTWSLSRSLPALRGAGGLALIGHVLHFFGGETSARVALADHWAFDLDKPSDGWVKKAPMPNPVTHPGSEVLNGKLYVFGGQHSFDASSVYQNTTYSYDPATDTWKRLADMPGPLSHLAQAAIVRNNKILVFGGEWKWGFFTNSVLEYDPVSNAWSSLTPLPAARSSGLAGLFGDKVVFTCGQGTGGFRAETYIGTFS